jgi:hypothetical protein
MQLAHDQRAVLPKRVAHARQDEVLCSLNVDLDDVGWSMTACDKGINRCRLHRYTVDRAFSQVTRSLGVSERHTNSAAAVADGALDDIHLSDFVQIQVPPQRAHVGLDRLEGVNVAARPGEASGEKGEEPDVCADVVDDIALSNAPRQDILKIGFAGSQQIPRLATSSRERKAGQRSPRNDHRLISDEAGDDPEHPAPPTSLVQALIG